MSTMLWTEEDEKAVGDIIRDVPGYSGAKHYFYFRLLLATKPKSLLMLGCYHGRDICFILSILSRYHPEHRMRIVGVDKFSDTPCADWPEGSKSMTWEQAGFGAAPSVASALININRMPGYEMVQLAQMDDETFLRETDEKFGCAYLDTAHDKATVLRQIGQMARIADGDMIICGDDFQEKPEWGVIEAVKESFPKGFRVFADYIWHARLSDTRNAISVGQDVTTLDMEWRGAEL